MAHLITKLLDLPSACQAASVFDLAWLSNVDCLSAAMSKALGYAIIAGSFGFKVPEILKLRKTKISEGRSTLSAFCDILAVLVSLSYNFAQAGQDGRGNPFSTYGENFFILPQNIAILYLILLYGKGTSSHLQTMVGAIAFVSVASSLLLPGLALRFPVLNSARDVFGAPDSVITALFAASTPVVILSRANTVRALLKPNSAQSYAIATYFLQFFGSAARTFTTYKELVQKAQKPDYLQFGAFAICAVLNLVILCQLFFAPKAADAKIVAKSKTSKATAPTPTKAKPE